MDLPESHATSSYVWNQDPEFTIQSIKPVFMMSPLSIAKYIPPGSVDFDLVVFDEASRVRPVEALGAIIRGRQAVVVGDSKQLPPTSFFDRMADGGEDEASRTADLESILGMFCAQGGPLFVEPGGGGPRAARTTPPGHPVRRSHLPQLPLRPGPGPPRAAGAIRLFGFKRSGPKIVKRFRQVLNDLVAQGAILREGSLLQVLDDAEAGFPN